MKKSIILLLVVTLVSNVLAQKRTKGDWILLKEPRTNLVGKQVSKLIPKSDNTYELNLFDGPNQITEKDFLLERELTKEGTLKNIIEVFILNILKTKKP